MLHQCCATQEAPVNLFQKLLSCILFLWNSIECVTKPQFIQNCKCTICVMSVTTAPVAVIVGVVVAVLLVVALVAILAVLLIR